MEMSEHKKQQEKERMAMRAVIKEMTGEKDLRKELILPACLLFGTLIYYATSSAYWMKKAKSNK